MSKKMEICGLIKDSVDKNRDGAKYLHHRESWRPKYSFKNIMLMNGQH